MGERLAGNGVTARVVAGNYAGQEAIPGPEVTPHQKREDEWQRFLEKSVGEAIGRYLTGNGRLGRRISQLEMHELEAMGIAACAEYVRLREAEWAKLEAEAAQPDNRVADLSNV